MFYEWIIAYYDGFDYKLFRKGRETHFMQKLSMRNRLNIGLTLFSMFFGAGNLIFPPLLGAQAGSSAIFATIGMIISAVCFPILAVAVVAKHDNLIKLVSLVHPALAPIFTVLVCLLIGPLIAIPRTASTSFEMIVTPFLGGATTENHLFARVIYSAVFFAVAGFAALHPNKLKTILGRILSPVLLLLICVIFIASLIKIQPTVGIPTAGYEKLPLVTGFVTGYQTMDILAALNFGLVIAVNIEDCGVTDPNAVAKETVKAGIIAGIILAAIYSATSYIGVIVSGIPGLRGDAITGTDILTYAIKTCFGKAGEALIGAVFLIACFDVCTGLLSSCSEYFSHLVPKISYFVWLVIFAVFSFAASCAGLSFILKVSFPILKVICFIACILIVYGLIRKRSNPEGIA